MAWSRLKFQAKVLIPVVSVMVLFLIGTMWMVNSRIQRQLQSENRLSLFYAEKAFTNAFENRANNLLHQFTPITESPEFISLAKKFHNDTDDPKVARDSMIEETAEILANTPVIDTALVMFVGPSGQLLAGTNRHGRLPAAEFHAACSPWIAGISQDEHSQSQIIQVGGSLFDVVAVPCESDQYRLGTLIFGVELGDAAAQQLKPPNGGVAFFANHRLIASTFADRQLNSTLLDEYYRLSSPHPSGGGEDFNLRLNGEHYGARPGQFPVLGAAGPAAYLLLSSYEQSWQTFQEAKHVLLIFSLLGIVLSTGFVWLLVRRVTQPLRQLRDSAEAVGRGDFSRRIQIQSRDEVGELAAVFNQMTGNIQKSREQLEKTVDILRATQAQLIHSEKLSAVGEFVAGVAHELNNPLTALIGYAELLQTGPVSDDDRSSLQRISNNAERCHKIVQSLLSFARQHPPERKLTNINSVIDSVIEILIYELRTNNIHVVKDFSPALPRLLVDPHQLQQVFLNIVNNARQAIEAFRPHGVIRFSTRVLGQKVQIRFQDDGPGISAENLAKIFNPFFTTKPVGKGTGLGLSLSYGIIQEHGGAITAESKPGQGTTFIIDLPITPQAETALDEAPPPPTPLFQGAGRKILVVDDEHDILNLICRTLERSGYHIETALDGEIALRRLREQRFDLIVSDWKMPGVNGQQLYQRLLETDPEAARRVVFMTGDVLSEKTEKYLNDHGKTYLTKPFSLADFHRAIADFFDH